MRLEQASPGPLYASLTRLRTRPLEQCATTFKRILGGQNESVKQGKGRVDRCLSIAVAFARPLCCIRFSYLSAA